MEKETTIFLLYPSGETEYTFNFKNYPLKDIRLISTKNVHDYSALNRMFPHHYLCEYILSGSGTLTINGRPTSFNTNSTIFIQKGDNFSIVADTDTSLNKISIIFSANYIEYMLDEYSIRSGSYNIDTMDNFMTLQEFTSPNFIEDSSVFFSDNIHQILMKIYSHLHSAPNAIALNIKNALDSHIYKTCTIVEIAESIHISKDTLNRIFKKHYNRTPYDYLLCKKIDVAKKLLVTTNCSVQHISYTLAYHNERYFSDLFTNKVGLSPSDYRNKFSNVKI